MKLTSSIRLLQSKNAIKQVPRKDSTGFLCAVENYAMEKGRQRTPSKGMLRIVSSSRLRKSSNFLQCVHRNPSTTQLTYMSFSSSSNNDKNVSLTNVQNSTGNRQKNNYLAQRRGQTDDIQSLSARMHRIMEKRNSPHVLGLTQSSSELTFNKTILYSIDILFADLSKSLNRGTIKASGNNIHVISGICADALHMLSILPLNSLYRNQAKVKDLTKQSKLHRIFPFDTCMKILETLYDMGMDVTPNHIASAINIACKEEKYEEASNLFQSLYSVDHKAFSPMDPTLGEDKPLEVGLFAMAKAAQQQMKKTSIQDDTAYDRNNIDDIDNDFVARLVFDAANEMSMISARDRKAYFLGAVNALGRAGEWKACIDFLESDEGNYIGQELVATVMNACIRCNRGQEAIKIYEKEFLTNEQLFSLSEWQTGGNFENILPSCRNAAICAFRTIFATAEAKNISLSKQDSQILNKKALSIYNDAVEAGTKITKQAMESILFTCACCGNWEAACNIMDQLIDESLKLSRANTEESKRGVINDARSFFSSNVTSAKDDVILPEIDADMLSSVMHACNSDGQYGVGLFYAFFSSLIYRKHIATENYKKPLSFGREDDNASDSLALNLSLSQYDEPQNLIIEVLYSLCKVGECHEAKKLYDDSKTLFQNTAFSKNNDRLLYVENELKQIKNMGLDQLREPSTLNLIFNDVKSLESFLISAKDLSQIEFKNHDIELIVSKIMKESTQLGQPLMGLKIGRIIGSLPNSKQKGLIFIPPSQREVNTNVNMEPNFLLHTDILLSETIRAYKEMGWDGSNLAEPIIKGLDLGDLEKWPKSVYQCFLLLIDANDIDTAQKIFRFMNDSFMSVQNFLLLARGLGQNERWEEIYDLWISAKESYCISEELGLLTLKAISHHEFDSDSEKFAIFGNIIWEMARLTGMSKNDWKKSQYFFMKKEMLQKDVIKLMGWKKGENKKGEIDIALQEFDSLQSQGKKIPDDILMVLIRKAGYKQRHVRCRGNPIPDRHNREDREQQKIEREEGIANIIDVLTEARKSPFGDDSSFTLQVTKGLRALKANELVIEFVKDLVKRGVEVRPMTFLQAVFAAKSDVMAQTVCREFFYFRAFQM